jgi:undecaprenyl-diphosphatase
VTETASERVSDPGPGAASARTPIQPNVTAGTDPTLREATRGALVPRRRAALRTRLFIVLALAGLVLFGSLLVLVRGGLTADADLTITRAVQSIAVPGIGALMVAVSAPGWSPWCYVLVVGIFGLFWRAGYRTEAGFAVLGAASAILTELFKWLVALPRPGADLVAVIYGTTGNSFPSGHVLFYVTFFGFLAYLAYAQAKRGTLRTAVIGVLGLLVVLIGPSRIWMGHHWASDVLASYALGLTYLIVLVQAYGVRRLGTAAVPSEATLTAG